MAGLTSFFLMLGGIYFGLDFAMPEAQGAPAGPARLIQVLGHQDKFFTGNGSDSELRLDFIIEVPAGTVNKSNGSGLALCYNYQGTYSGTTGNGHRVISKTDCQNGSGDWMAASRSSGFITEDNLQNRDKDRGQQYRIIRIDNFGAVDRVTLSLHGDLGGNYDAPNPAGNGGTYARPVAVQAVVTTPSGDQYISYKYQTTMYNVSNTYNTGDLRNQKVAPVLSYDNIYNTSFGNSQTNWGYVVKDGSSSLPAGRMYVSFISPWTDNATARNAGVCTSARSFYYQWVRRDGTPTSITPTPVLKTITPMSVWSEWGTGISTGRVVDVGPTDFASEGPGYYQLVAWPIAVNPSRSPVTNCTDYSYYADSVGDLDHANAFIMGSVFYTGGSMAVGVKKTFDQNPMPYQGTTTATFTLDSGNSRISGVGFTDTFPSNLYITGITKDTCGLQGQSISQAQIDAIKSPDIKPYLEAGSLLLLKDNDRDGRMDTVKVQGGVAFNTQTGNGEIIGASVPRGTTCEIQVEVKHKETITGNSVCTTATSPAAQTNNEDNVSYNSLQTVLAYGTGKSQFGECLGVTRQADLSPTGAFENVLAGTTLALSSTVTSASTSPSEIDNAQVVFTAPLGTTLTGVTGGPAACTMSGGDTVATCTTGTMNPGDSLTYNYNVVVPAGIALGATITGEVKTVYTYDTNKSNDSAPITLTSTKIDLTRSVFEVSPDDIIANGTDFAWITAKLISTAGTPVTGMDSLIQASLPISDGKTTFSSFTEDPGTPGTYYATVSSTLSGNKAIKVTADGGPLASPANDIAHFIAGPLNSTNSTFEVDPVADPTDTTKTNWRVANGAQAYTGKLTALDSFKNPILNLDLTDIDFTSTSSDVDISKVINKGNGEYEVEYTSLVAAADPKAMLTVESTPIGPTTDLPIPFKAGAPSVGPITCTDPAKKGTNLSVSPASLGVGGTSTVTALITDVNCNPVPNEDVDIALLAGSSASLAIINSTTDANGIASATVTDNVAETVRVSAEIAAGEIYDSPQDIKFTAGAADPAQSALSVSTNVATVGDYVTATTVVKDSKGNPLTGETVTLTLTGDGTFGSASATKIQAKDCTTNASGTCGVTFTSPTADEVRVSAEVHVGANPVAVTNSPILVMFNPGPPTTTCTNPSKPGAEQTNVSANPSSLTVGGTSTIRAYITDEFCNPVSGAPVDLVVDGSATFNSVLWSPTTSLTTDINGVATVTLTDDYPETVHVTAESGALTLPGSPLPVTFNAGAVDTVMSSFSVTSGPVVADGSMAYLGYFYAKDSLDNPLTGLDLRDMAFAASSPDVKVSAVSEFGYGWYEVAYTSTVASDTYTASMRYKGTQIGGDEPIPFVFGAVSPNSGFTVSHASQTVGVDVTLTLTLRDAFGNPVYDMTEDKFKISSTNTSGAPELVYGSFTPLGSGVYTFTTTSKVATTFTFVAEVDGVELTAQPVTTFTAAGVAASTSKFEMTVNDQLAGGPLDKAVAYANDQYGNPVPSANVVVTDKTTGPNAGKLNPASASCTTDASGICELAWSASAVGLYVGEGTIDSLKPDGTSNLDIRFSAGNISAAKSDLVVTPTSLTVGGTSTATVTVRDVNGILVPSAVASFSLETALPGGAAGGPALSDVMCVTDPLGTCSVTLSSKLAGDVKVHATVPVGGVSTAVVGNGDSTKGSPVKVTFTPDSVCFTGCNPVNPDNKTRVDVTKNGVAADGVEEDIATAYAYDRHGNPVSGVAVETSTSDSDLKIVVASLVTGADGAATLRYTSAKAGSHNADVKIDGQKPAGSPVTLFFGAGTADPGNSYLWAYPGGPLRVDQEYSLVAVVNDAKGNEVAGEFVAFQIPGNLTASDSTCITDASGQCSVTVTTTVAGTYQVGGRLAAGDLTNSPTPIEFLAGPVCMVSLGCAKDPGVDDAHTTRVELTVNGQPADGVNPDVAVVYAFDKHGNPASGAYVASTSDPEVVVGYASYTGANGTTTIQYRSTVAGVHQADVVITSGYGLGYGAPDGSPVYPEFAALGANAAKSSWVMTPSGPLTVGTGSSSTYTAATTVRDVNNNVVKGAVVTVKSVQPGVTFPGGSTCTTNMFGVCLVEVYSTVSGTFDFTALLGPDQVGLAKSVAWTPDAVCAIASGCTPQPGVDPAHTTRVAVTTNNMIADGAQRDVATVYAFDQYGNPVPNALVLTDKVNAADALTYQTGVVQTDLSGMATVWYSSLVAGDHDAWVKVDGQIPANDKDDTGQVTLSFVPGPVSAAHSTLTVDTNSVMVGDTVTATATTRDANMNLRSGVTVSFVATGSANVSAGSCTTNSTGTCTVTLTDSVAEAVLVSATVLVGGVATQIQASPQMVTFNAGAVHPGSSSFVVAPGGPLVADGVAAYTGTFTARDSARNLLPTLDERDIVFGSNSSDVKVSKVTNHGDGTYTVTYSTIVASNAYRATLNYMAVKIGGDEPIPFVAGAAVVANSWLDVNPVSLVVGGTSTAKVILRDANNNLVGGATANLAVTGNASLSATSCVTNNVSGHADFGMCEVTLTDNTAETVKVTATLSGATIPSPTDVTFTVGAVSDTSAFTVSPSSQTVGVDVTLTLTVQDALGNPVTGLAEGKFEISSTNTSGLPELSYGSFTPLANGVYTFTTTSTAVSTFTFTAKVDGVTLTAKPTAQFTAAGVAQSTSGFQITVNDQLADGSSEDKAVAYAKDQYGNPVPNAVAEVVDKTIGVNAGLLKPATALCTTDASGTCELTWSATAVGQYVGEGTIDSLKPDDGTGILDIRFAAGDISATKSELVVSPLSLTVGGSSTATVTIRDTSGILIPSAVASFSLETTLPGGAGGPSLSAVTCVTDASGKCSVTVSSLLAGDVKVHATVSVRGTSTAVTGSPATVTFTPDSVCFTGCTPVVPGNTTRVDVTMNGVAADGVEEDIATAYAYDKHGNPVPGVAVVTSTSDVDLRIVTTSTTTAADGTATLRYTSTKAGSHTADVKIAGTTPAGSPVTLVFGSGAADPAKSTLSVSPAGPIQVDQSYSITANVNDVNGNPVDGAFVAFQIPGDVAASDVACTTNTSGQCSITVTSTVAGSHQIGARLSGGALSNSPVAVVFTAGPVCMVSQGCSKDPGVDPAHTTRVELTVNGQPADGVSPDVAVAYAFDKHGNPIQGAVVASSLIPSVVVGSITPTGVNGSTTIQYTSTVAGVHTADVTVDGGTPDGSPLSLAFAAQAGVAANSDWVIAPAGPLTVGTGAASTYTATATVRDAFNNEVQGAVVTLKSVQPGVTFPAGSTCTTDAVGECSVKVYSTVAGTFDFTALLGPDQIGTARSVAWAPDAVCAAASGCIPQPGVDVAHTTRVAVTTNDAIADGVLRDVATVYAFDQYGNPVPNALVQSTSTDADLTIQSGAIATNVSGEATIWYTSAVPGSHDAFVTVDGQIPANGIDNTGKIALNFIDVTAPAEPIILSPATGSLTNDRPLTVDGTAEPGSTVEVVDQTTGATVCTAMTDAAGKWTCQANLPDGDHTLTATATDPSGNRSPDSPVVDVTVDTLAPGVPGVDTSNGTEVSGGPGASEPGATIEVTWPDGTTGTTTVNPDGSWTIPTPPGTPSGEIGVTATDPAGNKSGETKKDLDTVPPSTPVIDEANKSHVTGTGEPDSKITVTWPDGTTSLTTVDPGGKWVVPTPGGMPSGQITVQAEDEAGNKSGEVKGHLDTDPPGAPVLDPTNGSQVTGKTEPGATIKLTDKDGNEIKCVEGVIVAGADGSFTCTLDTPLNVGDAIHATATDKAGNTSVPAVVTVGKLSIWVEFAVRAPGETQVVGGKGFIPGETLVLEFFSDPQKVGTAIVDANGAVVIRFVVPLGTPGGLHTVRLTGDKSGPHLGYVQTTFMVTVKVETSGSTKSPARSIMVARTAPAPTAMPILAWNMDIVAPTFRKKKVGA